LPEGHNVQSVVCIGVMAYLPARHGAAVADSDPSLLQKPSGHGRQFSTLLNATPPSLNVPGGHCVPVALLPAGQ
jgi:hypothetical protein